MFDINYLRLLPVLGSKRGLEPDFGAERTPGRYVLPRGDHTQTGSIFDHT
jgi:hypothetical protein